MMTMRVFRVDPKDKKKKELRAYAAHMRYHLPEDCEYLVAADDDDVLSGFAALLPDRDVTDILFLYVFESKRRKYAGSMLLRGIEDAVREAGGRSLRCIMPAEDNLMTLFTREGYGLFPGVTEYAVSFGTLYYSKLYRKHIHGRSPKKAKTLGECTSAQKRALEVLLGKEEMTGLLSAVFDGAEIMAVLSCEAFTKGILVDYMYVKKEHPELLLDCFRLLDSKLVSVYGERMSDMMLSFSTGNDMEEELIKSFSGGLIPPQKYTREYVAVKNLIDFT